MRRIALIAASFVASAALSVFLPPVQASALTATFPVVEKGTLQDGTVHLARHGGFRGHGFRGHGFRGYRGHAFRGYGYRGPRYYGGWRGRGWRGAGLALGATALAAPYYYGGGYNCPLVRRTVWTPRGYRVRWVRRCW